METGKKHRGQEARELLRSRIIDGDWIPGERLQPVALAAEGGWSTTVVREALTHLVGEGLIASRPNRGFFVPVLSLDELVGITELRCRTEELAIELSLQHATLEWESELIGAHHLLSKTPPINPETGATSIDWVRAHRDFHAILISACGVDKIREIAASLNDATMLYRRWANQQTRSFAGRNAAAEHRAIMDAALARDTKATSRLIREHYQTTLSVIVASGLAIPEQDDVSDESRSA